MARTEELIRRKLLLVQYLDDRRAVQDWHGVRDAATDLECVIARLGEHGVVGVCLDAHTKPDAGRRKK